MIEASIGIGLLFGPLLGALLFSFGGYIFPFLSLAGIYISSYPYIVYVLIKSGKELKT